MKITKRCHKSAPTSIKWRKTVLHGTLVRQHGELLREKPPFNNSNFQGCELCCELIVNVNTYYNHLKPDSPRKAMQSIHLLHRTRCFSNRSRQPQVQRPHSVAMGIFLKIFPEGLNFVLWMIRMTSLGTDKNPGKLACLQVVSG